MKIKYILISFFIVLGIISTGCTSSKKIKSIKNIKNFSFSYSNGYAMYAYTNYELKYKNNTYTVSIKPNGISDDEKYDVNIDSSFAKKVEDVLNKYNVVRWNGFNKSDQNVLDGDSFSMNIKYNDNDHVSANGYMMWPENYTNVKSELDNLFMEIYKEK